MACESDSKMGAVIYNPFINDSLGDDELRAVLARLGSDKDKENFGLVCKRWLRLQSTERKKLCARAGPFMLCRLAARFTRLRELDLSQSVSRSFFPGVTDDDLSVIATAFSCLQILNLQNCKGQPFYFCFAIVVGYIFDRLTNFKSYSFSFAGVELSQQFQVHLLINRSEFKIIIKKC